MDKLAIVTDIFRDNTYWIEVRCGASDRHYKNLGYNIPKTRDKWGRMSTPEGTYILVRLEHLPMKSNVKVTKVCDICGDKLYDLSYGQILISRKQTDGKDRCFQCGAEFGAAKYRENAPLKRSLGYKYPEIASSWHTEKNKGLVPDKIYAYSDTEYWWKCEKCESDFELPVKERTAGDQNCPYCAGRRVNHTNCLWTTNPEIAKVLWNPEDGYRYTKGSHQKVNLKCIECSNKVKKRVIYNINPDKIHCDRCSDGISYPEKFMINLLTQLGIDFVFQKTFKWSKFDIEFENDEKTVKHKKYDFYIPLLDCIIETHGAQHYDRGFDYLGGRTVAEEQTNDNLKRNIAIINGVSNYIIINCSNSNIDYLKNQILESRLSSLLDLERIDWHVCNVFASKSLIKEACRIWNEDQKSTKVIAELLKVNRGTIIRYLQHGASAGWCNYNPKEEIRKNSMANGIKNGKSVIKLNEAGVYIEEYSSATIAAKENGISLSLISAVCKGKNKIGGGFKWIYKEDYMKMLS